jgi:4-diphosphocytidyl-2C-methyl-D-erythritol 2-phosphate synthase
MIAYPNVKLNLGLHVVRRREDGYHDLETLFVPYPGIHDTLEIITGDDFSRTSARLQETYAAEQLAQGITPDGKLMITIARKQGVDWDPLKDLTVKAYAVLSEQHKLPPMKIYLEKTSPVGAGLGGGSADAAFALRMIAELAGLALSDEELAGLAARLGSDCAFFIYNRPMLGTGRGEILEPFDIDLSGYRIDVTVPEEISVSTADAYRGIVPKVPDLPLREVLAIPSRNGKACW